MTEGIKIKRKHNGDDQCEECQALVDQLTDLFVRGRFLGLMIEAEDYDEITHAAILSINYD